MRTLQSGIKVSRALFEEINKVKSIDGTRKATGMNIEYETMEELLKIADSHKVSKSGILRCFMRDGLDSIKSNNEVKKMVYEGMGHYTTMLEPSIRDSVDVISNTSKATKSNVMRHCVLIGLEKYRAMNKKVTEESLLTAIKNIPEDEIVKPVTEPLPGEIVNVVNVVNESLPVEEKKSSVDFNDFMRKIDFEKGMDKAMESMKNVEIKGHQLTITIKFE